MTGVAAFLNTNAVFLVGILAALLVLVIVLAGFILAGQAREKRGRRLLRGLLLTLSTVPELVLLDGREVLHGTALRAGELLHARPAAAELSV